MVHIFPRAAGCAILPVNTFHHPSLPEVPRGLQTPASGWKGSRVGHRGSGVPGLGGGFGGGASRAGSSSMERWGAEARGGGRDGGLCTPEKGLIEAGMGICGSRRGGGVTAGTAAGIVPPAASKRGRAVLSPVLVVCSPDPLAAQQVGAFAAGSALQPTPPAFVVSSKMVSKFWAC